jgi:hypothetical protein
VPSSEAPQISKGALVQALRLLLEGVHDLLDLPLVSLVQDGDYDLDSHRYLPAYPLLPLEWLSQLSSYSNVRYNCSATRQQT